MNRNRGMTVLLSLASAIFFAACWGDSKSVTLGPAPQPVAVSETACAQCHSSTYSSQSRQLIYPGYLQSKHSHPDNGDVVGCQDCHGGGSNHIGNVSAAGGFPYPNPDNAGLCFGCHRPMFLGKFTLGGKPSAVDNLHYRDLYTATGNPYYFPSADCNDIPAMYVSRNFETGCTACHEAHNPLQGVGKEQRIEWAESGHGNDNALPWKHYNFKARTTCQRCHTTTGFVNFVTSGYTAPTAPWGDNADKSREVLTCRGCHADDGFAVRTAGKVTTTYKDNNGSLTTFPDVGRSNLCLPCHGGVEGMASVKAVAKFDNASAVNSHYKAAAGTMFMTLGYTDLAVDMAAVAGRTVNRDNVSSKPFTYRASYTMAFENAANTGNISSTHRKLGTPLINGDTHRDADNNLQFFPGVADSGGPCVTCHMHSTGATLPRRVGGHTWEINAQAGQELCFRCHWEELEVVSLATFIEEQGEYFREALVVIDNLLRANYGIVYNPASHPYFFEADNTLQKVTDWTRKNRFATPLPVDNAMRLMGAAYNLNLLRREPNAFVHARTYTRRLCYDTIDYVDDGVVNQSTGATVLAFDPVKYQKGVDSNTPPTTEFYKFLIGYNRSTFQWNIDNTLIGLERP
jgi:hypothetical protein